MESPMSSAVSISSVGSSISSHNPLGIPQANPLATSQQDKTLETPPRILTPEYRGKLFFDPGDGDITICVNDVYFEAHKYLIKKFSGLRSLLQRLSPNATLYLRGDTYTAKDMEKTLKVLYATVLEGPFEFDHTTLVSALRMATTYDYPELSTYCIQHLQQIELTAVDRIKIAREFGLTSWEEPAYIELCERRELITMQEASILGMDMCMRVVGIREDEQRRVIEEQDAQIKRQEAELEVLKKDASIHGNDHSHKAREGSKESVKLTGKGSSQGSAPEAEMKPSFIGPQTEQWTTNIVTRHLKVNGCSCSFGGTAGCFCTLAPCAVAAFKNLQTQQISHADRIADLQSMIDELKASPARIPTPTPASAQPKPALHIHQAVHRMLTASRNGSSGV